MIYAYILIFELVDESINGDKHDFNSAMRLLVSMALAALFGMVDGHSYGVVIYLLARFAIFDPCIALLRGQSWDYLGSNFTDKILNKLNKYVLLAFRVASLIITTIL